MDQPPTEIAWDIETAPQPFRRLSDRQRRRFRLEYENQSRRSSETGVTELVRKTMSFHGYLCWICCVSFAWFDEDGKVRSGTKSTSTPSGEEELLKWIWSFVDRSRNEMQQVNQWVTFNGKKFDSRILRTRSLWNGVTITNPDLLDEYPYSYKPHCDVASMWREDWVGLEDAADMCDVEYVSAIDGSGVADAIKEGRPDLVEQHCDADARGTLRIFDYCRAHNPELR